MHGLMPQSPVVRHARAVGPVPSTATAAALFKARNTAGERGQKFCVRVNALIVAHNLAHLAFGPKTDGPTHGQAEYTGKSCS